MKRDWSAAREKVEREGTCRWAIRQLQGFDPIRPCDGPLEAAHILGREHDKKTPIKWYLEWEPYKVMPDRVVPLCRRHHRLFDSHDLDLLGYLTPEEEAQAVLDAGSLESARRRLAPSEYRKAVA